MRRLVWMTAAFFAASVAAYAVPLPARKPVYIPPSEKKAAAPSSAKKTDQERDTQSNPFQLDIDLSKIMANPADSPLNSYEIGLYKEVFGFQRDGNWDMANRYIKKIDNPVLLGHILMQRYMHPDYKTSDEEWKEWLQYFYDLPQSKLVDKRLGLDKSTYASRVNGTLEELRYFARGSKYLSDKYDGGQRYEVNLVRQKIQDYLAEGNVSTAASFFTGHRVQAYIDPIDKAQILAEIASHYLYLDRRDKAKATALRALEASQQAPLAGWVMGLIAWTEKDMAAAAKYFTIASDAQYASPWMTAAASYWGARASTRAKLFHNVTPLMLKAVQNQRTFYGLIATKAAGYGYDFNWTMPELTARHKDVLMQYPAGARILALVETGQFAMAEEELYALPIRNNLALAEAALAVAHHYNLAGYAMRFSLSTTNPAGGYYDAGMFPISTWTKDPQYTDQPLLNAFIRQESRFRVGAKNATSATGLMQVMPDTAAFVMKDDSYKTPEGQRRLVNPKVNVMIGERYLRQLLMADTIKGDLFGLAIAYNAGPGKLSRWQKELAVDDPLLFIELIPSPETRDFVEAIMTNYWIYQMQMGIEPKTLLAVAEGKWPVIY